MFSGQLVNLSTWNTNEPIRSHRQGLRDGPVLIAAGYKMGHRMVPRSKRGAFNLAVYQTASQLGEHISLNVPNLLLFLFQLRPNHSSLE